MTNWAEIFNDLKLRNVVCTVYLRGVMKGELVKIINVVISEVHQDHVVLQNKNGYGIVGYDDILYVAIPTRLK